MIETADSTEPACLGMELEAEDWEVRASMANGTGRSWVQVGIGTGEEPVEAYLFQLGPDPDTVFGAPETNYRLLVFVGDWVVLEGASGQSDVVKDLNELMEMRLSVHGGTLSISVDGTELFSTDLHDLPNSMAELVLGVWPAEEKTGKVGIFDWVEVLARPQGHGISEMGVSAPRPALDLLRHRDGSRGPWWGSRFRLRNQPPRPRPH